MDYLRDLQRCISDARKGLSRRWQLRIMVPGTQSPFAAPLASTAEKPTPNTDTVITGSGFFQPQRDQVVLESEGGVVKQKAYLMVHPKYQESFRKAYMVSISRVPGSFEVVGVDTDIAGVEVRVTLQSRQ